MPHLLFLAPSMVTTVIKLNKFLDVHGANYRRRKAPVLADHSEGLRWESVNQFSSSVAGAHSKLENKVAAEKMNAISMNMLKLSRGLQMDRQVAIP